MTEHQTKLFAFQIGQIYKAKINDRLTLSFTGGVLAEFVVSGGIFYVNGLYAGLTEGAANTYAKMVSDALAKIDLRAAALEICAAFEQIDIKAEWVENEPELWLMWSTADRRLRAALACGGPDSVEQLCESAEAVLSRFRENKLLAQEIHGLEVALKAVRATTK